MRKHTPEIILIQKNQFKNWKIYAMKQNINSNAKGTMSLQTHSKERLYENLIVVALGTSMRGGELLGLTWDDVDFRKREISINKTLVHIKDTQTDKQKIYKKQ